jgi:hypothetical protein
VSWEFFQRGKPLGAAAEIVPVTGGFVVREIAPKDDEVFVVPCIFFAVGWCGCLDTIFLSEVAVKI